MIANCHMLIKLPLHPCTKENENKEPATIAPEPRAAEASAVEPIAEPSAAEPVAEPSAEEPVAEPSAEEPVAEPSAASAPMAEASAAAAQGSAKAAFPDNMETLVMAVADLDAIADDAKHLLEEAMPGEADVETPLKRLHRLPAKLEKSFAESPGCDNGGCFKAGPCPQVSRQIYPRTC